jgi:hypothetical protein
MVKAVPPLSPSGQAALLQRLQEPAPIGLTDALGALNADRQL